MFKDAYSKSRMSDEVSSKRLGPLSVSRQICKNRVEVELPDHMKIHNVINVIHTATYGKKPSYIAALMLKKPGPVPKLQGDGFVVESIWKNRKKGRGIQFLTDMKGTPT